FAANTNQKREFGAQPQRRCLSPEAWGLIVSLFLILMLPTLAHAQAQPLDLASYERLLREGRAAALRGDRLDVEQIAEVLAGTSAVVMPDGTLAPVETSWLTEELARANPDLPLLAGRMGALLDALAVPLEVEPADALERLEPILAAPPFADREQAPREPSWFDQLLTWLFEQLGRFAQPVAETASGPAGTLTSWLLTAAGAALLIVILVFWLRGLRRTLQVEAELASPAERAARDTADARAQAASLAKAGDYRGAARMLALASLLWLDERGRLRYDPHQTNREHLKRLHEEPVAQEHLAPVVELTDRVWYGQAPLDAHGYAEVEQQVEALRKAVE
ncbi:DUF4129 domain-containing protein, partial [Candidatus Chloroploca asiatica]